jgi:septum formation protein
MRPIILASTSARRKEILERTGLLFTIEPSDYEEDMTLSLPPEKLVEELAIGKADAVAIKHNDAVVIGADTIVDLAGVVMGKPYTAEKAQEMLMRLSGKTHKVHTGFCIIDSKTGERRTGVETTLVTFKVLSKSEIAEYTATGESLLAAGAYMIQKKGRDFITQIEGDFDNIVGFPLQRIMGELQAFDIHR